MGRASTGTSPGTFMWHDLDPGSAETGRRCHQARGTSDQSHMYPTQKVWTDWELRLYFFPRPLSELEVPGEPDLGHGKQPRLPTPRERIPPSASRFGRSKCDLCNSQSVFFSPKLNATIDRLRIFPSNPTRRGGLEQRRCLSPRRGTTSRPRGHSFRLRGR